MAGSSALLSRVVTAGGPPAAGPSAERTAGLSAARTAGPSADRPAASTSRLTPWRTGSPATSLPNRGMVIRAKPVPSGGCLVNSAGGSFSDAFQESVMAFAAWLAARSANTFVHHSW